MRLILALFLMLALPFQASAAPAENTTMQEKETQVATDSRKSLSVTVYNDGLGLVKDVRTIDFTKGLNRIAFQEVSAQIQPETALFSAKDVGILEQNFNFDLMSRQSLLNKFLGREIEVISVNPGNGQETREKALVLSFAAGVVLKIGDRIETDFNGRLIFPNVPSDLREKPTLVIDASSTTAGKKDAELTYLTNGLTWRADYVAELNNEENAIALNGWVTMTNMSGVAYENASIQFVAGTVNRVRQRQPRNMMMAKSFDMAEAAGAPMMQQEALMDFHLYSLGRPTSILSNQTKQLALLSAPNIKAEKVYRIDNLVSGYQGDGQFEPRSVQVSLRFENDQKSGAGIPLPAGTIRVFKADSQKRTFFVGEDRINHTPKNEKVRLTLGEAFDVTVSGKQTDYTRLTDRVHKASYELEFKNAKDTAVTVSYFQTFPPQFTILSSNITQVPQTSSQVLWDVPIAAGGKTVLKYTVQVVR